MRLFKILTLLGGAAVFSWLLAHADLGAVARHLRTLGSGGTVAVLLSFAMAMVVDVGAWMLTFRSVAVSGLWTARLWLVLMVGEAFSLLTPLGAFGGEPFKAVLLNRHYGISYREGTAALVLIQTLNSLAEVPFVIIGAALMLEADILPAAVETGILAAAAVISVFMLGVYIALHRRALARLHTHFGSTRWAERLARAIAFLKDLEERLFYFVRHTPARSAVALFLAFLSWVFGAIEIYLVMLFLGVPITFGEAWIVETVIVLVRSATFFVPGHIGVQDGAIALAGSALTGSPDVGVAMALIRRGRELFWAGIGLVIYAGYNFRDRPAV